MNCMRWENPVKDLFSGWNCTYLSNISGYSESFFLFMFQERGELLLRYRVPIMAQI